MSEILFYSMMFGITAYIYSDKLTEPGMIFYWPYFYLVNGFKVRGKEIQIPAWIHKPLISCYKCVAGQMGLWYMLYLWSANGFDFASLFIVPLSIFFSLIFSKALY